MGARIAFGVVFGAALCGAAAAAQDPRPEEAVKAYCPVVETMKTRIGDCVDNRIIVAASEDCLKGFAERTLAAQRSLTDQFRGVAEKSLASQTGQDGNEVTDLGQADAKLRALDREAFLVQEQQQRYLATLAYAGGLARPIARQLGMEELLQGMKCFAGPRDALTEHLKKMHQRRNELGNTLAAMDRNLGKMGGKVAHLEALGIRLNSVAAGAKPVPVADWAGARGNASGSDITGLRRNEGSEAGVLAAQSRYARETQASGKLQRPEEGSGQAVQEILRLAREKESARSP